MAIFRIYHKCVANINIGNSVLKSRDITLLKKVCVVQTMAFPVVTYGCENWTIKKAEWQRIDTLELWCWRDSRKSPGQQGDQTSQA